ncbi:RecX family transcriptional regulator [Bacteroidales bacterium OttesenSCG-928-K03]|nr:RecX family transcriptional regulator [Bacteroidales bacterium OttesenSCG-928-K03]
MNQQIYNKISSLCSRKEMCISDAKNYLRKFKDISEEDKTEIINQLVEENFINEVRFAKAFVNDSYKYNKWGKYKIMHALYTKYIPLKIISEAIEIIDDEAYNEIKQTLAENKRNSLSEDDPTREQKVQAYLKSKGF